MSVPEKEDGSVVTRSLLYLAILALLPIGFDLFAKLAALLGADGAVQQYAWLAGIITYFPIYLLALFYLKTTFRPFAEYGYRWSTQHLGWAVYLGIGSGVIIFLMDLMGGLSRFHVQSATPISIIGYLISWAILPALFEETFFRGVIQRFYAAVTTKTVTRFQLPIAIFVAVLFEVLFHAWGSVYYGITHEGAGVAFIQTIPQLLYVAVFGAISGWLYNRTGSLVGPFVIHGLGNFTELILIWSFR